ncbi:MAG: class I SAM-dependent methyltransferase [Gemmatimonadota bacterium]
MTSFPDHFSAVAANYARFRPKYPPALFDWIAATAPALGAAWDCGCGNGQATLPLADRFERVFATDPSAEQIAQAPVHPRVTWSVAPAEASGLESDSVDVVAVAQALHWFDLPRFWAEVRRVVRAGGLFAAWSYGVPFLDDEQLAAELRHLHDDIVGPYWPKERGHVDQGYHTIDFPFERLSPPPFDMREHWSIDELAGYLGTWSATRRYIAANGADPVAPLIDGLRARWGTGRRDVRWPLTVVAGGVRE